MHPTHGEAQKIAAFLGWRKDDSCGMQSDEDKKSNIWKFWYCFENRSHALVKEAIASDSGTVEMTIKLLKYNFGEFYYEAISSATNTEYGLTPKTLNEALIKICLDLEVIVNGSLTKDSGHDQ